METAADPSLIAVRDARLHDQALLQVPDGTVVPVGDALVDPVAQSQRPIAVDVVRPIRRFARGQCRWRQIRVRRHAISPGNSPRIGGIALDQGAALTGSAVTRMACKGAWP